jgi:hypothetical protein
MQDQLRQASLHAEIKKIGSCRKRSSPLAGRQVLGVVTDERSHLFMIFCPGNATCGVCVWVCDRIGLGWQ